MKNILVFLFLWVGSSAEAQNRPSPDERIIKETVDTFFLALRTQDSTLFKKILLINGQVWSVGMAADTIRYGVRFFADDKKI